MRLGAKTWYPQNDERHASHQLMKAEQRARQQYMDEMARIERLRRLTNLNGAGAPGWVDMPIVSHSVSAGPLTSQGTHHNIGHHLHPGDEERLFTHQTSTGRGLSQRPGGFQTQSSGQSQPSISNSLLTGKGSSTNSLSFVARRESRQSLNEDDCSQPICQPSRRAVQLHNATFSEHHRSRGEHSPEKQQLSRKQDFSPNRRSVHNGAQENRPRSSEMRHGPGGAERCTCAQNGRGINFSAEAQRFQ